jgi:alpha-D-ribose 1-methylphosphonate 5-triphosphate synthase subunit PhnH
MKTLVAARPYDRVFDGQKHYRTLLQCTARPGTIGLLDDVDLKIPSQLNRSTALIALALFSADTSFCLAQGEELALQFIQAETAAQPATAEHADFLIFADLSGPDARWLDDLRQARLGNLAYPDLGATIVFQVATISSAPVPGALRLTLTGPGIETKTVVFVLGAPETMFESLREQNAEFPIGVDAFLTCDSHSSAPCVLALPRTTQVHWERI